MTATYHQSIDNALSKNEKALDEKTLSNKRGKTLPKYIYLSLSLLWLYSGLVPVFFAKQQSLQMLAELGISDTYQSLVFYLAALLDVVFGLLILTKYRQQPLLWLAQLVVVTTYSLIVAVGLPENLLHPFAPLIKNIPIIAILLFLYQYHRVSVNRQTH
ncbi:DoxX-like family protein [Psychrobacter sp. FDAARGOS_221]|uniref:DoxX-like family protein n=1 Tax=Psychrobacter sp. FDAARGOS_221 TaxID=1975705 RepID=UPI000BB5657E|nr:DoxX-like family protein [Psychrobacter sp. FDAARGOS_221]PNK60743.1 epimerase [Psychrobacter sp. FDAARGOS_221]